MAYTAWTVVFGETPSASKWNILGANDASFNSGTGFAAGAIAAASLASNAVTTAKIADNAVTAAKMEVQQSWIAPTFLNSWVNYDATIYSSTAYYKDSLGMVHIKGLVKNGTVNTTIFTLPAGYRPLKQIIVPAIINNTLGRVDVFSNGNVTPSVLASNVFISLDNIHFKAEA